MLNKKYNKKLISFIIFAIFLVALITLLFFINPEEVVNKIGVQNSYLLIFVVSFFGGFSAGGSITFISLLITLAAGGVNPIYLGIISGVSLAIGDMIMFYIGSRGRELVINKWDKKINRVANIFENRAWLKKILPYIAYLYIGFTPLPNDILILFLAAIKYPAKRMNVVIILGDISFTLLLAILASNGITYLS